MLGVWTKHVAVCPISNCLWQYLDSRLKKKTSATICHYLGMLKRQAIQNMSTKKHVGTRVTLALGITILQKLFLERTMLIENPKQVDPNAKLVDQKQIQHSHQQLVPNVVGSSSLARNNTQQYLITKGPRVIWFWYELNNQRHFFGNWGIARLFWNAPYHWNLNN